MAPPPHPHRPRRRLPLRPLSAPGRTRLLELYCGLGGVAAAVGERAEVVAAIDVDRLGLGVYRANFPHPTRARTLESVDAGELAALEANVWTLAPPCQPYTRRGRGRDDRDPRAQSLVALLGAIAEVQPPYLFLENVPGFAGSRMHARLRETLAGAAYRVAERLACPGELGVPNRRRRFYLVAAAEDAEPLRTDGLPGVPAKETTPEAPSSVGSGPGEASPADALSSPAFAEALRAARPHPPLAAYLDSEPEPGLAVEPDLVRRYRHALDVVDPGDPAAVTACFTSAYGRSPVRSGSYLRLGPPGSEPPGEPLALRRFSPREVLRLLGFPEVYRLPPGMARANAWRLAGNSLSLAPVRAMLAALPPLAGLGEADPDRAAGR